MERMKFTKRNVTISVKHSPVDFDMSSRGTLQTELKLWSLSVISQFYNQLRQEKSEHGDSKPMDDGAKRRETSKKYR